MLLAFREEQKIPTISCAYAAGKIQELINVSHSEFVDKIKQVLINGGVEVNNIPGLSQIFHSQSSAANACEMFAQSKKIDRYVRQSPDFISPVEYVLGVGSSGKPETVQYIPILDTLKCVLKHEDVLGQVFGNRASLDHVVRDISDGTKVRGNSFFHENPHGLQILLYHDDFEVSNPLGNKVKKYKISAFYFVLGNLEPKYRSRLSLIPLVLLCKGSYLQKYGIDAVLTPLIKDLRILETDGITLHFQNQRITLHGTLVAAVADNLGAHVLGNFFQKFSTSLRLCRFCNATRDTLPVTFHEKGFTLRTPEAHDEQAKRIEQMPHLAPVYGFKGQCSLNQLQHFHVIHGLPFDIAHDILEGLVPEVIGNVICSLVFDGHINLETINERILSFPFAESEKNNKPQPFSNTLTNFKVKLTAAETWCLIWLLPLMIGDKIPPNNPSWNILLDLSDVVELIFAHEFSSADILYMQERIETFHSDYHALFPETKMKPKGHNTLHYGTLIKMFGPLCHLWTLRFESKHSYFKELIHRTKNRINICKYFAYRHQSYQSLIMQRENILESECNTTGSEIVQIQLLPPKIGNLLQPLLGNKLQVVQAGSMTVEGTKYTVNGCVITSIAQDYYRFGKICNIYLVGGISYIVCQDLGTVQYCKHFHAYLVEFLDSYSLYKPHELLDYHPLGIYTIEEQHYVTLKYHVRY